MSVTAAQLSKLTSGSFIGKLVAEQVALIDEALRRHDKIWGRNVVMYDLPSDFGIAGLTKQDQQRVIYSSILDHYRKKAGLETALMLEDKNNMLLLAWIVDFSPKEIAAMNAKIREARITREKLPDFIQFGRNPAPNSALAARSGHAEPIPTLTVGAVQNMQPRGGLEPAAPLAPSSRTVVANGVAAERELLAGN